jgi:hypothetical protein
MAVEEIPALSGSSGSYLIVYVVEDLVWLTLGGEGQHSQWLTSSCN